MKKNAQPKVVVAASGLTLIACRLTAGGCGTDFETNPQGCEHLFDYFRACRKMDLFRRESISMRWFSRRAP